jgi:hypothetical protein
MKELLNMHKLCVVKVRANLQRQQEYAAEVKKKESQIIATSIVQHHKQGSMWLFNMYLREN